MTQSLCDKTHPIIIGDDEDEEMVDCTHISIVKREKMIKILNTVTDQQNSIPVPSDIVSFKDAIRTLYRIPKTEVCSKVHISVSLFFSPKRVMC